jgi:hypothetical protein
VEVLDFGIIPRRAGATTDIAPSARFSTVLRLEPSTLEVEGVFRDAVTTSLPYRSALRSLDKEYDLFLIDQDRIIGMNISVGTLHIYLCSVANIYTGVRSRS